MCNYIVGFGSEMYDMSLSFFEGLKISREELIGDTYFIRFESGDSNMTFSIHKNTYDKVKVDLRELRINSIFDN
jgi:hypothetical protein